MFKGLWINGAGEKLSEVLAIREAALGQGGDELDAGAAHILVYDDADVACAVGRLYPRGDGWHIDGIAVLESHQGQGYGDLVMRMLLFRATETYLQSDIRALVPAAVQPFFEKYGFAAQGTQGGMADMVINGTQVSFAGSCGDKDKE